MASEIVITGGGTAGHTNPGIAVGEALVEYGLKPREVHYVGAKRGNEGELVPAAGFTIDLLGGRGIQRKLTLANFASVFHLLSSCVSAFRLLGVHKPKVVLCLGGYASFAISLAAVLRRIPLVVSEQNARASAVNRLFGRFATVCALPFPATDLPNGVLTGNPTRSAVVSAVTELAKPKARELMISRRLSSKTDPNFVAKLAERKVVAVWSGSLGARSVNQATIELAEIWAERDDVVLYHIVGRRDWPELAHPEGVKDLDAGLETSKVDGLAYLKVEYEAHMAEVLVAADVAVCRAGASTVSEVAIAGLPTIMVPLPGAPRDHQFFNTRELVENDAALSLVDSEVNGKKLAQLLDPILADDDQRQTMSNNAAAVARPLAAQGVASLLLEAAGLATPEGPPNE